jgi:hypothetical protein
VWLPKRIRPAKEGVVSRMNTEQAECLKYNTCGLIEVIERYVESMKSNGMPKKEVKKIESHLDYLFQLNQKYVKLSTTSQQECKAESEQ